MRIVRPPRSESPRSNVGCWFGPGHLLLSPPDRRVVACLQQSAEKFRYCRDPGMATIGCASVGPDLAGGWGLRERSGPLLFAERAGISPSLTAGTPCSGRCCRSDDCGASPTRYAVHQFVDCPSPSMNSRTRAPSHRVGERGPDLSTSVPQPPGIGAIFFSAGRYRRHVAEGWIIPLRLTAMLAAVAFLLLPTLAMLYRCRGGLNQHMTKFLIRIASMLAFASAAVNS